MSLQGIWFPDLRHQFCAVVARKYFYYIVFALLMLPRSTAYRKRRAGPHVRLASALFVALALSPSYFLFGAFVWLLLSSNAHCAASDRQIEMGRTSCLGRRRLGDPPPYPRRHRRRPPAQRITGCCQCAFFANVLLHAPLRRG